MIVSTEGDLGDSTYVLGILSELPGGPHTLLLKPSGMTKYRGSDGSFAKFDTIFSPLARSQPYIAECRPIEPGESVDWRSELFRSVPYRGTTLLNAHLCHLISTCKVGHGITGLNKWLFGIKPSKESEGRIVINRTARYRNWTFPWSAVVNKYKHRLMFVGLEHEWREFCGHFGYVDFRPTENLLQVAQLIAGSLLFIGNQSCANAVAEGLKHRLIQETDLQFPDCLFKRDNAQHVVKGNCVLPGFDDEDTNTDPLAIKLTDIDTITTPPGGWMITTPDGEVKKHRVFSSMVALGRLHGFTREEVVEQNIRHNYEYFFKAAHGSLYDFAENAMTNAGITR